MHNAEGRPAQKFLERPGAPKMGVHRTRPQKVEFAKVKMIRQPEGLPFHLFNFVRNGDASLLPQIAFRRPAQECANPATRPRAKTLWLPRRCVKHLFATQMLQKDAPSTPKLESCTKFRTRKMPCVQGARSRDRFPVTRMFLELPKALLPWGCIRKVGPAG